MKPEIGSSVRLRSGGPAMTVQSIRERGESIDDSYLCMVFCRWFDETKHLCEANFDLRTLENVPITQASDKRDYPPDLDRFRNAGEKKM